MEGGSSWLGGVDWTSVEDATQCPVPLPPPSRSIDGLLMQAEDMISEGYAVVLLNIDEAGTLFVTNFRLIFVMGTDAGKINNFGTIPLATIEKFGKQQTVHSMSSRNRERLPSRRFLQIVGKDMRTLVFGFRPHTKQRKNVFETLTRLLRPLHLWGLYAFSSGLSTSYPGGNPRLRLRDEYLRIIGLHKESYQKRWWTLSDANADYNLCSTYPSMFMMPSSVSDEEVQQAAAFRVRGRFPVLCWQHPENGAVLARSSQPRVGIMMNSRSTADEKLVAALCPSSSKGFGHSCGRKLYIADARPRKNALANGAMGGGSESSANYLQCEVVFLGIDNIHAMRDSLARLRDYLDMHGGASSDGLFSLLRSGGSAWVSGNVSGMSAAVSALGDSGWLVHVHSVLAGAAWIAARVSLEGASVLVHCSDGWDRTTQLVSLASLLLDPYYRTFQGFQVLVEKDWLAFGHPFADRLGMPTFSNHPMEVTRNSSTGLGQSSSFRAASGSTFTPPAAAQSQGQQLNNYSPIFLQWIDCISQLIRLYPHAFEFTSAYLVELLDCILSCRFGNFLCNSEKERLNAQVWDSCGCLWKYLEIKRSQAGHQHQHFNVFYKSTHHPGALLPPAAVLAPVLWPHFYLRWVSYGCAPCFEQGGELEMQARAFYHRVSSAEKERDSARSQVKELVAAMRVMTEQINVERQAKLSAMSMAARYLKQAAAVKHAVETMGCKIRFTRPGNHGLDDDEAEAGNDSSSEATARESGDEQQLSICVSLLAESDASGSGGDEVGGLVSTSQAHAQTQEEEVAETNHLNGCREGCNWPHTGCARLGSTLVGLRANFDALENLSILDRYFDIT